MRRVLLWLLVASGCATRPTKSPDVQRPMVLRAAPRIEPTARPKLQTVIATTSNAQIVIVEARITPTGVCKPYAPMLTVEAVVANRGESDFPGSPGYGLVGAHRDNFGSMIGNGGPVPAIKAGQRVQIEFPIFFPVHDPETAKRASRYEVRLDLYDRYPGQMDMGVLARNVARPCAVSSGRIARD